MGAVAVASMEMFFAGRSRTGGSIPVAFDTAWVTLALMLLLGASLQFAYGIVTPGQ